MKKNKKSEILMIEDLIKQLKIFDKNLPVKVEYRYNSGCKSCGSWNEEGEVVINDLETRIIISHE